MKVRKQLEENGGPTLEEDLELCREWACEVGRYSFSWHLTVSE